MPILDVQTVNAQSNPVRRAKRIEIRAAPLPGDISPNRGSSLHALFSVFSNRDSRHQAPFHQRKDRA